MQGRLPGADPEDCGPSQVADGPQLQASSPQTFSTDPAQAPQPPPGPSSNMPLPNIHLQLKVVFLIFKELHFSCRKMRRILNRHREENAQYSHRSLCMVPSHMSSLWEGDLRGPQSLQGSWGSWHKHCPPKGCPSPAEPSLVLSVRSCAE